MNERLMRFLCSVQEPYYGWLRWLGNVYSFFRCPERIEHPGLQEPDKIFYVIRDMPAYAGLGSWYDRVLGYLERAEKKGWTPIIVPQLPAQEDSGDWDCYFSGIRSVSEERVSRFANVVNASTHAVIYKRYNRMNVRLRHRLGKAITLSQEAEAFVRPRLNEMFRGDGPNMVGVMFRGTDYRKQGDYCPVGHAKVPSVDEFCNRVEEDLRRWKLDHAKGDCLFVVTEEQEALESIRKRFPNCLSVVKERFSNFKFDKWLAYQRLPHTTPKENNFLYLLDIYALSKCQYLIGGVNGCVLMALNLNGNRYRDVDILNTGVN